MNDQPSDQTPEEAGGAAPGRSGMPPMTIGAQYIKDLSFENPQGPEVLAKISQAPSVEIEVAADARTIQTDVYEVTLTIRGEAKADVTTVFIIELTYGGIVTLNGIPEENVEPLLLIEGARHLFPFARSIVSNVTRDGGLPPLLINPVDFASLYANRRAQAEDSATA